MSILVSLITGLCCGISAGIGFFPIWKQPKNIKIQFIFGILGLIGILYHIIYVLFLLVK